MNVDLFLDSCDLYGVDTLRIDALAHRCLRCQAKLQDRDRVFPSYQVGALQDATQLYDLGLLYGNDVRVCWHHVDCADPTLRKISMRPDVTYCYRCKRSLKRGDAVSPTYQVTDPRVANPHDSTDIGITLGDRIYFAHIACDDAQGASTILVTG